MKTYCHACKQWANYTVASGTEKLGINGYRFETEKKRAFCCECQKEVWPDVVEKENIRVALEAYIKAKGE